MAEAAAPENRESWDDTQIQFAFNTILHQHGQFRVNSARIVSPPGYQPKEVSVVWESLDPIECRQYIRSRGLVSKRRAWMPMSYENDKNWKYMTYFMSDDCKFCGFVSESIEMDHKRDVIQIESVKYNKAAFCIYLDSDYLHGPVIITGENCHFKMSGENGGRKLIYFAFPNEEQLKTKNRQDRLFVICIYDFETKGVTVIADENICEETINQIEWTPDGRGVIFHRRTELFWYRFGEQYVNKIYSNIPQPLRISFSPDEKRLAVFLPTSVFCEKSILLFHWPFVKAAVQFQHDVITLGSYKVWSVPDRPWSHGGSNLVFNANCQHHVIAYSLAIDTLSIHKLRFCRPSIVVDVNNDEMLFETVAANSHSRLWISSLSTGIDKTEFSATLLTGKRASDEQMFNFNVKPVDFDNGEYTGILYLPPDNSDPPGCKIRLVVYPYAGEQPNHTLLSVHPLLSVLINWGHAILVVNHREPFVVHPDSDLPDFATSQDIDDFHNAVVKVLSDHKRLDENYVCLYGYMYGSFVAANVIKRHPNFYKCAAFVHPILDYPYIPENEDEDDEEDQEPLDILDSRAITIPTFLVLPKDDDHEDYQKYRQLAAKGVQCFGHSELEDEESHDYIVKILHFFKYPYDAFPRRVDDVQSTVEEAAAKN